jgi:hypothetical protein
MHPEPPTKAEEYFKQLKNNSDLPAHLSSLIATQPPTFEESWRDFKGAARLRLDPGDNIIKSIWSKALGAMANTEGGVLIWGIRADKADKDQTKVDAAHELSLCPDVNALVSRLKELLPSVTSPPVLDVEILPVAVQGCEGFVICHIPRSRFGPHRSDAANKRFFVRFQDHSDDIPVDWLRKMFAPKITPDLMPLINTTVFTSIADNRQKLGMHIFLKNVGSGTARDVFVRISATSQMGVEPAMEGWSRRPSGQPSLALAARHAIHPGEVSPPIELNTAQNGRAFVIELEIFADNQPALKAIADFPVEAQRDRMGIQMLVSVLN